MTAHSCQCSHVDIHHVSPCPGSVSPMWSKTGHATFSISSPPTDHRLTHLGSYLFHPYTSHAVQILLKTHHTWIKSNSVGIKKYTARVWLSLRCATTFSCRLCTRGGKNSGMRCLKPNKKIRNDVHISTQRKRRDPLVCLPARPFTGPHTSKSSTMRDDEYSLHIWQSKAKEGLFLWSKYP